jgi:hypothetical protein
MRRAWRSPSSTIMTSFAVWMKKKGHRQARLRDAGLLARRARRKADLAVQDLIVVLLHDVLGPLLQVRVRQIAMR